MGGNPLRVCVTGPLGTYASGFASELRRVGYTENSTASLRIMGRVMEHRHTPLLAGRVPY